MLSLIVSTSLVQGKKKSVRGGGGSLCGSLGGCGIKGVHFISYNRKLVEQANARTRSDREDPVP